MATKRDYYEVIGVEKSASADEIKRAYRKKALELHPDRHGGDDSKFKELGEAYEVLKDPQKKQAYDQFGHNGQFGAGQGSGGSQSAGFEGFDFSGMGGMGGFGDIFDMFFRGGQAQGGGPQRGQDIEVAVELKFEEAVFGVTKEVGLNLQAVCDRCNGSTAEPGTKLKTCQTCKGVGQVSRVQNTILGSFQQTTLCPTCRGRKQIPEQACNKCRGTGVLRQPKSIKVRIPAGVDNGSTIRLAGEGEASRDGLKGDLFVHIRVRPSRDFMRQGHNILSDAKVGMADAALGVTIPVQTVDGQVKLKVPAGTQSGKVFKLSEKGVPFLSGRGRGDHLVKVEVETPTKLTAKQKELLEQFQTDQPKRFWQK